MTIKKIQKQEEFTSPIYERLRQAERSSIQSAILFDQVRVSQSGREVVVQLNHLAGSKEAD